MKNLYIIQSLALVQLQRLVRQLIMLDPSIGLFLYHQFLVMVCSFL